MISATTGQSLWTKLWENTKQEIIFVDVYPAVMDLYDPDCKWKLIFLGEIIEAAIKDKEWLRGFLNGEIALNARTVLRVKMEVTYKLNQYGRPVPFSQEYSILRVFL